MDAREKPFWWQDSSESLEAVLLSYLKAAEAGQPPEESELLARHPHLARELAAFFADQKRLKKPLADVVKVALPQPTTRPTVPADAPLRAGRSNGRSAPQPKFFGDYKIIREVGEGGMGIVYLARQVRADRVVALKKIKDGRGADAVELLARFRREAQAIARLRHPYIVQVHEVGERDGCPFFSMEYCSGGGLDRRLRNGPLPPSEAAHLGERLARAVHDCHRLHIVHRDLKPANVLLAEAPASRRRKLAGAAPAGRSRSSLDGWVPKISDFGLAKRLDREDGGTRSNAIMGTPAYMAPEQAAGRNTEVGKPADVYALGAILYECLTGRPPFKGATPVETLRLVTDTEPPPPRRLNPEVPRDLETICLKCLHKDPAQRYPTAAHLALDLRRFRAGEPIQARPVGSAERCWRWCRRKPLVAALMAAVLLGATLSAVLGWRATLNAAEAEASAADAKGQAAEAGRQKQVAVDQWTEAEKQRKEADRLRRVAVDAANGLQVANTALRESLYFGTVRMAEGELRSRRQHHARRLLDACPKDLCGWEWRHLMGECERPRRDDGLFNLAFCGSDWLAWVNGSNQVVLRKRVDTPRPEHIRILDAPEQPIRCLAASADGRYLAVGGVGGQVLIWDLSGDKPNRVFEDKELHGRINAIAFSPLAKPDDRPKYCAYAGADREVRFAVLDKTGWKPFRKEYPDAHRTEVRSLAFDPTGARVVTTSVDTRLRYWNIDNGSDVIKANFEAITAGGIHPQGKYVALAKESGAVVVFSVEPDEGLLFRCEYREHAGADVLSLCFSADDKVASVSDDGAIRVWEVRERKGEPTEAVHVVTLRGVGGCALSKKGHEVAWIGTDGVVRWRLTLPNGNTLAINRETGYNREADRIGGAKPTLAAYSEYTHTLAYSADGQYLATGSIVGGGAGTDQSGELRIWDARTGRLVNEAPRLDDPVWAVAFSRDGGLAWGGRGRHIHLWPVDKRDPRRLPGHKSGTECLAFSPDGKNLASGGHDGTVRLWDVSREISRELPDRSPHPITAIAFAPDGSFVTADQAGILVYRTPDGKPRGQPLSAHVGAVNGAVFSPDGKLLATTGDDGLVKLWHTADLGKAEVPPVWTVEGHGNGALGVCFSPDGTRLATTGRDKAVRLWETATGREALALQGRTGLRFGIAFRPDGRQLAAASAEGVKLWDADPQK
jgi:WD40 repeat protein/serine/threonine protein kinase